MYLRGKFDMADIQNATLAGGVAIGTACNFMLRPFEAFIIGSFAGIVSCSGFNFIQPYLKKTIDLDDTCGVHNLHGMPGIIAAFSSFFVLLGNTPD